MLRYRTSTGNTSLIISPVQFAFTCGADTNSRVPASRPRRGAGARRAPARAGPVASTGVAHATAIATKPPLEQFNYDSPAAHKRLKPEGGGRVDEEGKETKYLDPVTGKQRVRIDGGHVDKETGEPVDPPSAAAPHVHGYDKSGKKIRDETGDPHFPLKDPAPSSGAPSGSGGPGSGGTTESGGTGGNGEAGCIPPNQVTPPPHPD
jgi:hypothetical protein